MLITPANLNLFFTQLETRYSMAHQLVPKWHEQVVTVYPASTEAWVSGWLGMLDKLRVWNGPRQVRQPAPQTYSATVLPFELTESVDKFKLQDDQFGIYFPMFAFMGEQSGKWPDYQVRDLIEASGAFTGPAQVSVDGVNHWSSSHPVDFWDASKGTYTNDYGASGTVINSVTVGGAFSVQAYTTVWQDHAKRKNESGERIGIFPDLTMGPADLHFPMKAVLQSYSFAPPALGGLGTGNFPTAGSPVGQNAPFVGAMDSPLRGSTDILMNPDLASAVAWYLLVTKKVIKPFGWVLRQAPIFVPRQNPDDPVVFDTHTFLFGVEARGVAVWSLPWLASRSGV